MLKADHMERLPVHMEGDAGRMTGAAWSAR